MEDMYSQKNETYASASDMEQRFELYLILSTISLIYMCCCCFKNERRNNLSSSGLEESLVTTTIEKKDILFKKDEYNMDECSICLEHFIEDEPIIQLKCNHIFHAQCIDDWLQIQENCPLCRRIEL